MERALLPRGTVKHLVTLLTSALVVASAVTAQAQDDVPSRVEELGAPELDLPEVVLSDPDAPTATRERAPRSSELAIHLVPSYASNLGAAWYGTAAGAGAGVLLGVVIGIVGLFACGPEPPGAVIQCGPVVMVTSLAFSTVTGAMLGAGAGVWREDDTSGADGEGWVGMLGALLGSGIGVGVGALLGALLGDFFLGGAIGALAGVFGAAQPLAAALYEASR